jgi:hypothetical protein
VQAGRRVLGSVQQVRPGSARGDVEALVVKRRSRSVVLPVSRVLEVDPWDETVVVSSRSQSRPPRRVAPRTAAVVAGASRAAAGGVGRQAPRAERLARSAGRACRQGIAATRGWIVVAAVWAAPRARRLGAALARGTVAAGLLLGLMLAALLTVLARFAAWFAATATRLLRRGGHALGRGARAGERRFSETRLAHAVGRRPPLRRPR